jgi:hypothetical protein
MRSLETRVRRLEARRPQDDGRHVAIVSSKAEAEAVRQSNPDRRFLIVITGVPRPVSYLSLDTLLPEIAERGRCIHDRGTGAARQAPITHAEDWRVYEG